MKARPGPSPAFGTDPNSEAGLESGPQPDSAKVPTSAANAESHPTFAESGREPLHDNARTSRPTPASLDLMDGLVQVSFTVIALLSKVAAANDLSLTQLRALAILRDREPKMAELAAYLGQDRSSVSGLIDRAAKRGLVQRSGSSDDGRAVRVSLTTEGHALAAQLTNTTADLITPLTGRLPPADQKRLATLLTELLT